LDGDDTQLQQTYAKRTILKNVRKQIDAFKEDELNVGDKVRIRMDQVSNNIRALVKANEKKKIVVTWSPVIFKILKKITPRKSTLERSQYVIGNLEGTLMLVNKVSGTKPRRFYSNSLKKVDENEKNYALSMQEAIQLSGVELNQNDVYSAPYKP
jgi:putative ribosome biogenesis GTPase RsgA